MAGGRTNTQRIESLESQAANMAAWFNAHDTDIQHLKAVLEKWTAAAEGHTLKITVIEERLLVVDLKAIQGAIVANEKEILGIRKDIEVLQEWKDDLKKEKEESTRRWWSFGPSITAALISGIITLVGAAISVGVNLWLNKPK